MKGIVRVILFGLTLGLYSTPLIAQEPSFQWARSMGGSSVNKGYSIAVDAEGNVYITGFFSGTVDFDPGPGSSNLTAIGDSDIFVQKLDGEGNFVWAKSMGGSSYDHGYSIAVDPEGNVYTTGYFRETVDFDPGPGTSNLTAIGLYDIFVQKLDGEGNFVWAKSMGGVGNDYGESIAVDAEGNVYTTGSFYETVDFDPGPGASHLTSNGSNDIFVQKLDGEGNFVWAKSMGEVGNDFGESIAVDAEGNVYTTGSFYETVDFDPGPGTSNLTAIGDSDIFVQKLDVEGNFVWAKSMGRSSDDNGFSIAVDAEGNVYTTGYFYGTVDFDPGPGSNHLTANGGWDIFVQKLDGEGNFVWARSIGGRGNDYGESIAVDPEGNVYTTGSFNEKGDVYTTTGFLGEAVDFTSNGDSDIFVQKLDVEGNFVWAKSMGGSRDDKGSSIAVDPEGNIYTTGYFEGTVDFDPGPGSSNLTSNGSEDIFVQKLSQCDSSYSTDVVTAYGSYQWIDGNTYTSSNNTATHTLTNQAGCDSVVTLSLTLLDIEVSVDNPAVTEGNSGTGNLRFTVSLPHPAPDGGATVQYASVDDSATAGSDYTIISGTLSFAKGETGKTVDIVILGDEMVEADETVLLTLSNPTGSNVVITNGTGTGTISNDDHLPVISPGQVFTLGNGIDNGTVIGTVLATDTDAGTSFSNWTILSGNRGDAFAIDPTTGELTLKDINGLDFVTAPVYTLTVTVSDGSNTSAEQTIEIRDTAGLYRMSPPYRK
ncbi:SBBP repeat-containing protein [Rapidithrix thailandica]|uniref:SBBP repeat-containing protein n=1 Tax=Rapidithrix thailandica TaxID=413964 RepID=A0AAW9RVH7_9BACT